MTLKKKTSRALTNGKQRNSGYKSIDPAMDFGDGLSVENLDNKIKDGEAVLESYNETLSQLKGYRTKLNAIEAEVNDLTLRMFNAIAGKFGNDSIEYGKAGGKRKSERKHPVRKPKVA